MLQEDKNSSRKPFTIKTPDVTQHKPSDISETITSNGKGQPFRNILENGDAYIAIGIVKDMPVNYRDINYSSNNDSNGRKLAEMNRGDIMTQSLRRQTRKTSKPSMTDVTNRSLDPAGGISMRGTSPDKFLMFNPDDAGFSLTAISTRHKESRRSKKSLPATLPSSREDVQVLNLQGFMDTALSPSGSMNIPTPTELDLKRKSKKRRGKKLEDPTDEYPRRLNGSRRKRHSRSRNRVREDGDGEEVALRDLDELDDLMSGLVAGPKETSTDPVGVPITLEEASELRKMLTGNQSSPLPPEWMLQNFQINPKPNLSYGLIQKKASSVIYFDYSIHYH